MKIATWNVNSLRVRLPQVLDWLKSQAPDVLCLQETKVPDEQFPVDELRAAGYSAVYSGQKTYNGVAILSRTAAADVSAELPGANGEQKRFITATVGGVRVLCVYVPNGESVSSDKYRYKLGWLERLREHIVREATAHPRLVLAGDYNIAPEERDVHDPKLWAGQVLFSEPERAAFRNLLGAGLVDAFRLFEQPDKSFSWWDYRMQGFRRNLGLRIDHILLSPALVPACRGCTIDLAPRRLERPSDHAPVVAELALRGG
jgi:exodeoxyribonuclease-3